MKRWRKYLFSIWTPVFILAALNMQVWAELHVRFGYSDLRTISPERGNFDAVLQRECCDRGCTDRIVLRRWGFDTKIFVYEPAVSDPKNLVVAWLSPDELKITVDEVSHIYSQKAKARGVRITYKIGKVDDPYP